MCYHRNGITSDEDNKSEQADSDELGGRLKSPSCLTHHVPRDAVEFQRWNVVRNDVSKYNQRIETMIKLVKRMEQEGEVYVELRSRMRS